MVAQTTEALSNATGINIDDEYALQLRLEQSYQASSKLITVINAMMQALLDVT
jgi:flagellar hook-associated protein 1 FlgK